MKSLPLKLLIAVFGVCPCLAEKAVPFEQLSVTIGLDQRSLKYHGSGGYSQTRINGQMVALTMTVEMSSRNAEPEISIRAMYQESWRDKRGDYAVGVPDDMPDEDLAAFLEVANAASDGKPLKRSAEFTWNRPEQAPETILTSYESRKLEEAWVMSIRRKECEMVMPPKEIGRVLRVHREAMVCGPWFKGLLNAEKLPEKKKGNMPPRGALYSFRAKTGEVSSGGLVYQVDLSGPRNDLDYWVRVEKEPLQGRFNRGHVSGPHALSMMRMTSEAAVAADRGQLYSFRIANTYEINADAEERVAVVKVSIYRRKGDHAVHVGKIDRKAARAIEDMLQHAEEARVWYEKHKDGELFCIPPLL